MAQHISKVTNGWYEYKGYTILKNDNARQSRHVDAAKRWLVYQGTTLARIFKTGRPTKQEAIAFIDSLTQN